MTADRVPGSGDVLCRDEEIALTQRVEGGDREAWGTLHQHFIAALTGFIAARIGNTEDAEDLAQECFLRARQTIERGSYNSAYRVYTFLRSIAVHVIASYWERRSVRAMAASDTESTEELTSDESAAADPRFAPKEVSLEGREYLTNIPPDEIGGLERLELLRLIFLCCAKPHQLVAFGLMTILEWRPRELLAERADCSLGELAREFFDGYHASLAPFISQERFQQAYCPPLVEKLRKPLADVYAEHEYAEVVANRGSTKVEDVPLKMFFGRDSSASLSDWCDKVKRRARKTVESGILCRR